MRICELFQSIQGEGEYAGTPSVFVRTTGCNLRCWFCDTPYSSWNPEGSHARWRDVLEQVLSHECQHVVVTGGEPLLQPDVVPFTHALCDAGRFVTIETAGTVFRPVHADLMSISPKRPNSTPRGDRWELRHEQLRDNRDVLARFIREFPYQLKYVVDQPEDLADVEEHLRQVPGVDSDRVFLMPQATEAEELHRKMQWIEAEACERGYRVSPRLHIEMFGNVRGT
jgi:7-carboxy-7-deazaguanine synthase